MTPPNRSLQEKVNRYLSIVVILLLLTAPPVLCGLFYLSQVPDIVWTRDDQLTFDRVWMFRTRRPVGIGYQTQRVVKEYSATEICVQNRVRFFLWRSVEGVVGATSSHKMIFANNQWQPTGQECP